MRRTALVIPLLFIFTGGALSQIKVTVDHNTNFDATSAFRFKNVPSPARKNAAANARLKLVVGQMDSNSPGLKALTDGILPGNEDEPEANFFFADGSDGGRFLLDLGRSIDISQVNTYSWHPYDRAPQVYNLFASNGSDPQFNPEPDAKTDPASCGWKLIATVDTRPNGDDEGGQYGVSIGGTSGGLGNFRYLLFDAIPTETDDPWGNTFFSEVNVIEAGTKSPT